MIFDDRTDAGRQLAEALTAYKGIPELIVLALPRGGLPVAVEVATALGTPLHLLVVRKIGTPFQPELAMGAVASGGVTIINEDVTRVTGVTPDEITAATEQARAELEEKESRYGEAPRAVNLEDRPVILVDDGVATGATMRAAIAAARAGHATKVTVAVPTAAVDTARILAEEADEFVCLDTPDPYMAVGYWYRNFQQVSDDEVAAMLAASKERA
jgi:putative phosphoribosyl transferase